MASATDTELSREEQLRVLTLKDLGEVHGLCAEGRFCWLDLEDPSAEEVEQAGEALGLDSLAIEDTQDFGQRPKLDIRHDQALLVTFGARRTEGGGIELIEVHIHVSGKFVLTVHRSPCQSLIKLGDAVAKDPPPSRQWLIYRLMDTLTDSLLDVLDDVTANVVEEESNVYTRPRASDRDRMAQIRRSLDTSRRTIQTQRQLFERMRERVAHVPIMTEELIPNYDDIADHLWRAVDDMETARDGVQSLLDQYSNVVQERLTIVATIFLPLTVVTGFFGMNFNWLINHIGSAWTFWGVGVGGLIVSALTIRLWLIKTGMYDRG